MSARSFYLDIPKTEPYPQTKTVAAFDSDFENLLAAPGTAAVNEEGWADVVAEPAAPAPVLASATQPVQERSAIERLPVLGALARPNELFNTTAPYIMIIDCGVWPFSVECSHEPSLELLCQYLNKWGKTNVNDSLRVSRLFLSFHFANCFFFDIAKSLEGRVGQLKTMLRRPRPVANRLLY